MGIVDLVPVCGSMKKYRRRGTYHRLKSTHQEVSDCSENVAATSCPNAKMVQVIPKVQPKIRFWFLSINLLKRFRDAYVEGMLHFAQHVAHMNINGDIYFLEKIQDDVQYCT